VHENDRERRIKSQVSDSCNYRTDSILFYSIYIRNIKDASGFRSPLQTDKYQKKERISHHMIAYLKVLSISHVKKCYELSNMI